VSKSIEQLADILIKKTKHFLITKTGKLEKEASSKEFYEAFCSALKEEIMINWTATLKNYHNKQAKTLYYLSMEYLPGKFLVNNTTNLGLNELITVVLKKTNRSWQDLFDLDPDAGLGNGGLGRLASCLIESLATQKYPCWAYGLRYQYGIFEQELWEGLQVERPDCWLLYENPWESRNDTHAHSVYFRGRPIPAVNSHNDEVFLLEDYEEVRAIAYDYPIVGYASDDFYNVNTLRLWSTKESPRNFELQRYNAGQLDQAGENTSLTDVLYPNDHHDTGKRIRLKQEFLLVSASLQDIIMNHLTTYGDLRHFAEKVQIQINDTHPSLIIAELTRRLIKNHDFSWDEAWETTQQCCNYTNHTVLKESLEEWNEQRLAYLLPRQFKVIQKLNQRFCNQIRAKFPNDEEKVRRMSIIEKGQVKMANLAIFGCKRVNGVAQLHTEILKTKMFKDFFDLYPEKFVHITNGISPRAWLISSNPELSEFLTKRIGNEWIKDFHHIHKIKEFAKDKASQEEFLKIKKAKKEFLNKYLCKTNAVRDSKGKIIKYRGCLGEHAIYDMQIKRIHEYKRQLLNVLHLIMLYQEIKENPNHNRLPRNVIFAGKAAPGYEIAKNIISLICCLSRKFDEEAATKDHLKVLFVENYNVSTAALLIPAADLSEQISTAGMEASGTGNMKLAINGALTIGTEDGANIEMRQAIGDDWWPFSFGMLSNEVEQKKSHCSEVARKIYEGNEKIRKAVDALKDGTFAQTPQQQQELQTLHQTLTEDTVYGPADRFFVLSDLMTYYETQKKVEQLYIEPNKWAEFAINNIGGMGRFSSDEVIYNYVQTIWGLEKCSIEGPLLQTVCKEFSDVLITPQLKPC